ncbi:AbrB/MazE/SpoVT family DNA-binding domain-containing protein [Lacticaseibacillus paracasei]|jgi:antitoxin component of MazEF toxin-antitoxin module|uniref:AbrB family transcriptional regulator n=1 Tax=Lacticaseibacillus paracasei TaxID=1597 RepID=UPI0021C387C6|nr:AbrB family transcriptional regulator [Lacticaseibacillus paracasei]MCP9380095.1 AbrB family transcriptional regulator [Lacticaseibacillus paracasei]
MAELTIRKIGNSLGSILPKGLGLQEGDKIKYTQTEHKLILDLETTDIKHDRELIEESFRDFETGKWLNEETMKEKFGEFGWGK